MKTAKPKSPLRAAREAVGLTIRAVREATGISVGRLSMMERFMARPSPGEMVRLACLLNSTVDQLFPPEDGLRVA